MDREHFSAAGEHLREQGQSIRAIAAALGVNRGRVERAIKISALQRSYRPGQQSESRRSGIFVGRQHEMDILRTTLEDALAGQDRLVMLGGEPGIGKTRTAQELATRCTTGRTGSVGAAMKSMERHHTGPGYRASVTDAGFHSYVQTWGAVQRLSLRLCRISRNDYQVSGHCHIWRSQTRPDSGFLMPSRASCSTPLTGSPWYSSWTTCTGLIGHPCCCWSL